MQILSARYHVRGEVNSMKGGRSENQDSFGFQDTPLGFLIVVCDGMGGGPSGQLASRMVTEQLIASIAHAKPGVNPREAMAQAVQAADRQLHEHVAHHPEQQGMGTTMVAVLIGDTSAVVAHIGDSRLYRLSGNRVLYRTEDHSLVALLVQNKTLTEEEARTSPQSSVLTRAFGSTDNHQPDITEVPYRRGDRFVLCTDGIWGVMPHDQLLGRITAKDDVATIVNALAIEVDKIGASRGGGHDNHTLAIVETESESRLKDKIMTRLKLLLPTLAMLLAIQCALPLSADAQCVTWQMKPTDYASVSRMGNNLYLVVRDGKKGIVRADGTAVVPVSIDEVGNFYEHRALLLCHDGDKERIAGYLTDDGQYVPFSQKLYTLKGQEFYSDDMLTVADEKGRKGYVDAKGVPVFGFDRKYFRIKPFTEGFAAVSPKQNYYHLVSKTGEKVIIKLPQIGEVGQVTNAYKGTAYVLDTDNNCYTYNVNTGKCEVTRLKDSELGRDYLFRLKKDSKCTNAVPFVTLPEGQKGLSPVERGGKLGFEQGGHIILPAQLESATPFEDNLSVVSLGGKLGILRMVEADRGFAITSTDTLVEYGVGSTVSLPLTLTLPNAWQGKAVEVGVTDHSTGDALSADGQGAGYTMQYKPTSSGKKQFDVEVSGEGLLLWRGSVDYRLKRQIVDLVVSGLALHSETADENDQIHGAFTVTNPNEETMSVELVLKKSAAIGAATCPASLTLQPGESRSVAFTIVVKKDCTDQSISVSTSRGGQATLNIANLNAY